MSATAATSSHSASAEETSRRREDRGAKGKDPESGGSKVDVDQRAR